MLVLIVREFFCMALASIIGLYAYRYMNLLHRLIFFQLLFCVVIYILSFVITSIQRANGATLNNQWLYNLSIPVETGFLTWAVYEYFKSYKEKFLIWIGFLISLAILISELVIKGISVFSNHGYIAESVLLLVLYLFLLYVHFTKQSTWKRSPEIWIAFGIVIYFGGIVPYLSLINYLQQEHPKLNNFLFNLITIGLENVRYLLLAFAFWLISKNAMIKSSVTNE